MLWLAFLSSRKERCFYVTGRLRIGIDIFCGIHLRGKNESPGLEALFFGSRFRSAGPCLVRASVFLHNPAPGAEKRHLSVTRQARNKRWWLRSIAIMAEKAEMTEVDILPCSQQCVVKQNRLRPFNHCLIQLSHPFHQDAVLRSGLGAQAPFRHSRLNLGRQIHPR